MLKHSKTKTKKQQNSKSRIMLNQLIESSDMQTEPDMTLTSESHSRVTSEKSGCFILGIQATCISNAGIFVYCPKAKLGCSNNAHCGELWQMKGCCGCS